MMKTQTHTREVENTKTTELRGKDPALRSSRGGPYFECIGKWATRKPPKFEGKTCFVKYEGRTLLQVFKGVRGEDPAQWFGGPRATQIG